MSLSSLAYFQSPQLLDSFVLSSLAYLRNSFLSGVHVDSNAYQFSLRVAVIIRLSVNEQVVTALHTLLCGEK